MRRLCVLAASLALAVMACSGDGGGSELASACDLADAALVGESFNGDVAEGVEGTSRNCTFDITGGDVVSVSVFYYGTDDGWEGTRSGFEANRGGTTDVAGVGDEAFHPNDVGPSEIVARAGGQIYSVTVFAGFTEPTQAVLDSVSSLATAIGEDLG